LYPNRIFRNTHGSLDTPTTQTYLPEESFDIQKLFAECCDRLSCPRLVVGKQVNRPIAIG